AQNSLESYENKLYSAFLRYIALYQQYNANLPYHFIKRQAVHFFRNLPNITILRNQVLQTKNLNELMALVELSFKQTYL
ncbi:MAG: hypothetical protein ACFFDT_01790, partial [Candidatus Hodarchaeota archaeon]